MSRNLLAFALLLALAGAAHAFGFGLGDRFGRMGVASAPRSVPPPPSGCTGVIDASAGCPLPMLGS